MIKEKSKFKGAVTDPEPLSKEQEEKYEYYISKDMVKSAEKKYESWIAKAKKRKDWRPKQRVREFMSKYQDMHLFTSEEEIRRKGYEHIIDEIVAEDGTLN